MAKEGILKRIKFLDTFDGAKPRFLNRGKKRRSELALSLVERVNPEHTPGACPERSRRIRPGSRMG
jgi:hypothetical protein